MILPRAKTMSHATGILAGALVLGLALLACVPSRALSQSSPHGAMKYQCEECHSPSDWKEMKSPSKFSHKKTGFALSGQHSTVQCTSCHTSLQFAVSGKRCADCHTDMHRGELGAQCERCHSAESWLIPDMKQRHTSTRFALVGAHAMAQCQECHRNTAKHEYVGLQTDCVGCHRTDYETSKSPNHRVAGFSTDCVSCHAVNASRWGGFFNHAQTGFPLLGAHAATPCSQCHTGASFRGTTTTCVNCHRTEFTTAAAPVHAGFSTDCRSCHSMSGWHPASLDHAKTNFPLLGAHLAVACQDCHKNGVFKGTSTVCYTCHQADFTGAKSPTHAGFPTDCTTCHTMAGWHPSTFDHGKTAFPLTGMHVTAVCAKCHVNSVYKGTATLCYSCHQQQYISAVNPSHTGFPTDCKSCHSTAGWRPASFDHSKTLFPLTGAHQAVACTQCHKNNVYAGTTTLCYGCHQQDFSTANAPPHTGFSTNCTTCHTTAAWQPATFNHATTTFPLTGAHTTVVCAQCHKNNVYAGLTHDCYTCHTTTFALATKPVPHTGFPTACASCHTTNPGWAPSTYSHALAVPRFPQDSKHPLAVCSKCHQNATNYTQYCCQSSGCHNSCQGG